MGAERERFIRLLKEKGLKVTNQRILVLEAIESCPDQHLTAEEIFGLVKNSYPEIGLATVYRTIQLLNELHLIDRINFDDGFVRYEMGRDYAHEQKHHHHHLICRKCRKVISFREDLLEGLEAKIADTVGFHVVDHDVKLYGYCVECGGDFVEEKRE